MSLEFRVVLCIECIVRGCLLLNTLLLKNQLYRFIILHDILTGQVMALIFP